MTRRVAFLRAVNLGRRTVPNARLAEICAELGYGEPWTFINSGNVAFDAPGRREAIEAELGVALEAEFGFEVTTFVRSVAELRKLVALDPFEVAEGDTYFVTFLKSPPPAEVARALEGLSNDVDTLVVAGRDVHWRMHGTSMESSLKQKDWAILGEHATTSRNMTMLRKLIAKLERSR